MPPVVFVSYAHESPQHRAAVIEFAAFLRDQGIEAVLDAWLGGERQDWYAWALREMSEADYVIVVASEKYRWITDGHGGNLQHKGVRSEAAMLREMVYTDRERWFPKILPVLLPGHHNGEIPLFLQPYSGSFFAVTELTVSGAEGLLRVILRQPAHMAPRVAAHPPALPVLPNVPAAREAPHHRAPRQLPLVVRDFVGRTGPLAALDAATRTGSAQVVTIDGAAGVGKTTLAVHWAHRAQDAFPDGTLFANLRGHGPGTPLGPASVLASFLHALGVPEERVPADLDVLVGLYRSLVAGRRMLILLDNAGSAEQVRPLLPATPGCVTVVTSRATLTGLVVAEAARRVVLDLFTQDEATDLVCGVVGADRVAAEPDAAVELVRLCAGLPLAVRVAASRVGMRRHTSIADVVEDIAQPGDRLDMLSGSDDRTAVRVVLDWSYTALPAEQARAFRLLGLHPLPEFGVHAAAALTGLDLNHAYRMLEALAEVHLLEPVGRRRYRCHDLLHVYAAERAESDDALEDLRRALTRMVTWYAQTATAADRLVFPANPALPVDLSDPVRPIRLADRDEAWSWLTTECDAVLAALRHAAEHRMTAATLALAAATRFLALRPRAMWHHRLTAETLGLLAARAGGDRPAAALFLGSRADTHQMMGHWVESDADLDRLVELARELDDPLLRGGALCGMGRNRKLQHRDAEALPYYQRALPLVRGSGYVEAVVECNLSQISARLGRHRDALGHARRELVLRQECGDPVGEAYALHNMMVAEQGLGDHHTAITLGENARAHYQATAATEQYLANLLETMAISFNHVGDHGGARQCLREAATILTVRGDSRAQLLLERADSERAAPTPAVNNESTSAIAGGVSA